MHDECVEFFVKLGLNSVRVVRSVLLLRKAFVQLDGQTG
jgi:hypothetical protein